MIARAPLALSTGILLCAPLGAGAHPHIFVSTALHMEISADLLLTAVDVTWAYDELYTMVLLDELGLDQDYDGKLTPEELDQLEGYDLNWIPGFEGDLYLSKDGDALALGPPESLGVAMEDGQFISRHRRPLVQPVAAQDVLAKAYDPSFYTGYDLQGGVTLDQGCTAGITAPVIDDAYQELMEAMAKVPADAMDYPQVGESFADEIRINCPEGS